MDQEDIIDEMRRNPKSWVNLTLIGLNIIVFFLVEITGSSEDLSHMVKWGAAYTPYILEGEYYRLFTSMFLHFGAEHLINNMVLLFFVGYYLEQHVGKLQYLLLYLGGGLLGNLCSLGGEWMSGDYYVSAGASGAVFAVLGALFVLVLRHRGQIGTLSVQRLFLMILMSVYVGFTSAGVDNLAHVGGLIGGALLALVLSAFTRSETRW